MTTLREVQLTELGMLRFLDRICRERGLKYTLIGGSMLGAIRHKGFIPWDDDIDVYMPIQDVAKLQEVFLSDDFFLQTPETDLQMPFIMFKMRKNQTQMIEPGTENLQMHQGIWLDIFPYCQAAKSAFGKKMQKLLLAVLQTYRCRFRYVRKPQRRLFHWFLSRLPRSMQLWIDRALCSLIRFCGNRHSNEIFAFDVGKYNFFKKSYFENLQEYPFENIKVMGIQDYDGFLTFVFGNDYMTPRKWHHIDDLKEVRL